MRDILNKKGLIYFGICFIILFMFLTTYSFLNKNVLKKTPTDNLFSESLKIDYIDTSNISIVNPKNNDVTSKNIKIKNNSNNTLYYSLLLDNITTNLDNLDKLTFAVKENNKVIRDNVELSKDSVVYLLSSIKILQGDEKNIQIDIKYSNLNQNNSNKTFSSNLKIEQSKEIKIGEALYNNDELGYKIINDLSDETKKNGVYTTNNTIDGFTSYYYKGNSDVNNNVAFANNCFKIVRTTINGGIRLIYNGKLIDNECGKSSSVIEDAAFNNKSSYNAHIGYMYGDANSSSYLKEHENKNSSNIKDILDKWYNENISKYNSYIEDSIYCQDRSMEEFKYNSVSYGISGYGSKNTGYSGMYRNVINGFSPTYDCKNIDDRLSKSNKNIASRFNYSVGLITVDEVVNASLFDKTFDKNSYLNINENYWTMTPAYYNASGAYNFCITKNEIKDLIVSDKCGVRPVITLKKNTKVISGDGSLKNPFKIN